MDAGVVYDGVVRQSRSEEVAAGDGDVPKLFVGLKLWFSHSIPQRRWFMENAEANGASIVSLEQQADIRLVDHARKNQAPGTYSYQFVEDSVRRTKLQDLEPYRVGASARVDRPVGSVVTGPKGTRAAYTEEEDQFLWDYITPFREKGGSWKGNEIYKQVEILRPRHTYQSWRDRYIKYVQYQQRTITATVEREDCTLQAAETEAVGEQLPALKRPSPARQQSPLKRQRLANSESESVAPLSHQRSPRKARDLPQLDDSDRPRSYQFIHAGVSNLPRQGLEATAPTELPVTHKPIHDSRKQSPPRSRPEGITRASSPPVSSGAVGEAQAKPTTPKQPSSILSSPLLTPASLREASMSAVQERGPAPIPDELPGHFERKHFKKFWRISQYILDSAKDGMDLADAFNKVAREYEELEHTGQEWRLFWQIHVLPEWLHRRGKTLSDIDSAFLLPAPGSQAGRESPICAPDAQDATGAQSDGELDGIACSHCYTKESIRWRRNRRGKIFCNDCGILLKESRLRSISGIATDHLLAPLVDEQETEDHVEAALPSAKAQISSAISPSVRGRNPNYSDAVVQTSPPMSPKSPQSSRPEVDNDHHAFTRANLPGPNQSRKRSAGRTSQSTSQESKKDNGKSIDEAPGASDEEIVPLQTAIATEEELEIPSTPEHLEAAVEPRVDFHSPGRPPLRELSIPSRESSPLFVPQDGDEPTLPTLNERVGSSPLNVRLVENPLARERIVAATSSDSDKENDVPSSEAGDIFEASPEMSQDWETAPEEPPHRREHRLPTQELFQSETPDQLASDFDLPAPEGGWELLGIPEADEDMVAAVDETPEVVEISSDSEEEVDVDLWLSAQKDLHHGVRGIDQVLKTAIEATSFDFELAAQVVVRMVEFSETPAGHLLRREGKVPPPDDVPGCWTEADDNLLHSLDARELGTIEHKHGRENCEARLEFLEAYENV